jgi:RNA 2',3'-cyclic 3'-phosphodiesterase
VPPLPDRLRLFVALTLDAEARARLAAWADPAAAGAGWRLVAAENLHVTVVFIGAAPAERVAAIEQAMRETFAAVPAITVRPAGLRRLGRVLAVTLEPVGGDLAPMVAAQAVLAERLERVEGRPWLPHVTLARARGPRRPPTPELPALPLAVRLGEVGLYVSQLHPSGARYRSLAAVALKAERLPSDADVSHGPPPARLPDGGQPGRRHRADVSRGGQEGDP